MPTEHALTYRYFSRLLLLHSLHCTVLRTLSGAYYVYAYVTRLPLLSHVMPVVQRTVRYHVYVYRKRYPSGASPRFAQLSPTTTGLYRTTVRTYERYSATYAQTETAARENCNVFATREGPLSRTPRVIGGWYRYGYVAQTIGRIFLFSVGRTCSSFETTIEAARETLSHLKE